MGSHLVAGYRRQDAAHINQNLVVNYKVCLPALTVLNCHPMCRRMGGKQRWAEPLEKGKQALHSSLLCQMFCFSGPPMQLCLLFHSSLFHLSLFHLSLFHLSLFHSMCLPLVRYGTSHLTALAVPAVPSVARTVLSCCLLTH